MSKITNDRLPGLAQDSCTHMATVGVKGLTLSQPLLIWRCCSNAVVRQWQNYDDMFSHYDTMQECDSCNASCSLHCMQAWSAHATRTVI